MSIAEIKKAFNEWKDDDMEVFIHTSGGDHIAIASIKLSKNGKGLDLFPDYVEEEEYEEESTNSVYGDLD